MTCKKKNFQFLNLIHVQWVSTWSSRWKTQSTFIKKQKKRANSMCFKVKDLCRQGFGNLWSQIMSKPFSHLSKNQRDLKWLLLWSEGERGRSWEFSQWNASNFGFNFCELRLLSSIILIYLPDPSGPEPFIKNFRAKVAKVVGWTSVYRFPNQI